jgi:hypothetical protein
MTTGRSPDNKPRKPKEQASNPGHVTKESRNPADLGKDKANPSDDSEVDTHKSFWGDARTIGWAQVVLTVVLVIVGIWAICIYGGQLNVMKGTLSEYVKEFTVSRRPWVSLTKSPEFDGIRLDAKGNPQEIDIVLTLRNAGNVPAISVVTNMHLVRTAESPGINQVMRECADGTLTNKIHEREGGDLIVPQIEFRTRKVPIRFREDDHPIVTGTLFLVGCIGYFDSREKVYQEAPKYEMSFVEQFIPARKDGIAHFETVGWGDSKDPQYQETKPN